MSDQTPAASREALAASFRALNSVADLGQLLGLRPDQVRHYAYGRGRRYHTFNVRKRRGGIRVIREPKPGLKAIQQRLALLLSALYEPGRCVHGFVDGRSVATNAHQHIGSDWLLNVDLKDFFQSINFGRVQGVLAKRYGIPQNIASVIAQVCTYEDQLPQGAPTSPVLSNMVAQTLDRRLEKLARRYHCIYTRYADDLSFSRNGKFPTSLGYWDPALLPERGSLIGDRLRSTIEDSGFHVNIEKVHLRFRDERQVVTGLVVNKHVNVKRDFVRRIRAMLYAWGKHGYGEAEREYFNSHDTKDRAPHAALSFRRVVKGHIDYLGMVRGTDHPWYRKYISEYAGLVPEYVVRPARHRRPRHLRTWKDSIWVIQTDESQGTAFELEGYGLVTCAHVLMDITSPWLPKYPDPHIYSPHNPSVTYPVKLLDFDPELDVAILDSDITSGCPLKPRRAPAAVVGEQVTAAGYPRYSGGGLWEDAGRVTDVRTWMGKPHFLVSIPIISGASGAPLMSPAGDVLGVASRGADEFIATAKHASGTSSASDDRGYGAIPIGEVCAFVEHSEKIDVTE